MGLKLPSFHPFQNITSAIGGLVTSVTGAASSILNTPAGSAIAQSVVNKYVGGSAAGTGGNSAPTAGVPSEVAGDITANQGGLGRASTSSVSKPDGNSIPFPDDWKRWFNMYQLTPDGFYLLDDKQKKQLDYMHISIIAATGVGLFLLFRWMMKPKKSSMRSSRSKPRSKRRR